MEKEAFEPTGLIPRSIIRTVDRFVQQLLPGKEKIALQEYRVSRYQILVSIKSLLTLILIPLCLNSIIKALVFTPLIEHFWNSHQAEIFLNQYQEKRAFSEMHDFSEKMFFESLLIEPKIRPMIIPNSSSELLRVEPKSVSMQVQSPPFVQKEKCNFSFCTSRNKYKLKTGKKLCLQSTTLPTRFFLWSPQKEGSNFCFAKDPFEVLGFASKIKNPEGVLETPTESLTFATQKPNFLPNQRFVAAKAKWSFASKTRNSEGGLDFALQNKFSFFARRGRYYKSEICTGHPDFALQNQLSDNSPYKCKATYKSSLEAELCTCTCSLEKICTCSSENKKENRCESHKKKICRSENQEGDQSESRPFQSRKPYLRVALQIEDLHAKSLHNETHSKIELQNDASYNEDKYQKLFQIKSLELAKTYNKQSILAITNLLGDFFTFFIVSLLFRIMRPELIILKSFLTESVYSLSDTTKSFLLILGMDLLVGFHSPRGWELALEGFLRHIGLPENENFILLFVALFPVFLDTVFKYWIFRYLNKISPSTVVTYHSMIE